MSLVIEKFHSSYKEDLYRISLNSNPYPWSQVNLDESLKNDIVFVARNDSALVGFAIFHNAIDTLELLLIVTDVSSRRLGVAHALLSAGLHYGNINSFEQCYLEVRSSNDTAIALYKKLGFSHIGERKAYYKSENGSENAQLFSFSYER